MYKGDRGGFDMGQMEVRVGQTVGGAAALDVSPRHPEPSLGRACRQLLRGPLVFLPQQFQIQAEKAEVWLFHLFESDSKILPGHLFLLFEMCFFYHLPVTGIVLMEAGSEREQKLHKGDADQTKDRGVLCLSGLPGNKRQMCTIGLERLQRTRFLSVPSVQHRQFSRLRGLTCDHATAFLCAKLVGLETEAALTLLVLSPN